MNYKFSCAKWFEYEPPEFWCASHTVKRILHRMQTNLCDLDLRNNENTKHFRTYIRTYNNLFAFLLCVVCIPIQTWHEEIVLSIHLEFKDDVPSDKWFLSWWQEPNNLQLYSYGSDDELANRMTCSSKVSDSIVWELMDMLRINPYSFFIQSLIDFPQLHNFCITFLQVTIYFMDVLFYLILSTAFFPKRMKYL